MGLRILLASDYYPPFIGGAQRQTKLLGKELLARGHQVSVVTTWSPGLPEVEDDDGVKVYRLKQLRTLVSLPAQGHAQRHQPPFADPVTVWQLRRLVSRLKPDVVHTYGWFSYSAAAALLGTNIPMLVTGRDYAYSCATRTMVYKNKRQCSGPAPRKCLECSSHLYGAPKGIVATAGVYLSRGLLKRKMSAVHSVSHYVQQVIERDFIGSSGPPTIPCTVIPSFREDEDDAEPGIDDAEMQNYMDRLPQEPFILFVGALRLVKGVKQLSEAYARLSCPPPLVLIGTVEVDTPRSFPPGVLVLDRFPHPAVMRAWERALFGVIPSLLPEPLGSVVSEGMSAGKAVIGTTPGGHSDMIVPGETGLLVPAGDVGALAGAMQKLIDDPELRERLGNAARERSALFTASQVVPKFEQMYRRLVTRRSG
jgi:glycosyltransferase involved in cell wall biosynthesis